MAKDHQFLALALMFKVCMLQIPGRMHLLFTSLLSLEFQRAVRTVGTLPFPDGADGWWGQFHGYYCSYSGHLRYI